MYSFAPMHKKKDIFYSFSPVFCRSIGPTYSTEASYNGVPTSVYKIQFGDFKVDINILIPILCLKCLILQADPTQHCFCRQGDPEKCPPKGTLDK